MANTFFSPTLRDPNLSESLAVHTMQTGILASHTNFNCTQNAVQNPSSTYNAEQNFSHANHAKLIWNCTTNAKSLIHHIYYIQECHIYHFSTHTPHTLTTFWNYLLIRLLGCETTLAAMHLPSNEAIVALVCVATSDQTSWRQHNLGDEDGCSYQRISTTPTVSWPSAILDIFSWEKQKGIHNEFRAECY